MFGAMEVGVTCSFLWKTLSSFFRFPGGGGEPGASSVERYGCRLLEINSGPGLEGRVDLTLCESIVDDTLKMMTLGTMRFAGHRRHRDLDLGSNWIHHRQAS